MRPKYTFICVFFRLNLCAQTAKTPTCDRTYRFARRVTTIRPDEGDGGMRSNIRVDKYATMHIRLQAVLRPPLRG